MNRLLALLIFTMLTGGCATFDKSNPAGPQEHVFNAPYEQVWRAVQLATAKYPRKIDDIESGLLETETMKADQGWEPPFLKSHKSGGYRRHIQVRLIKGDFEGTPAIKVVVTKSAEILHDFFTEAEAVPSDGLEEKVILYRVDRELQIDQAIQKAIKKKKGES
jgi:hypothetical protein